MASNKTSHKSALRSEILRRMKAIKSEVLQKDQAQLSFHLDAFLKTQTGQWGAYRPIQGEASPLDAINKNPQIQWAYPKVKGEHLEFYLNPKVWVQGAFQVEEPDPQQSEVVNPMSLEGFLVPGVAFDTHGHRLGRGKGYFDRVLEHFEGIKVGVAWESQIVADEIPKESFDVPMDLIITNQGVVFNSLKNKKERRMQK